jgi:hypothetical protein
MPCAAPPPPQVAAIIAAGPSSERPLKVRPAQGSASYIDYAGNLDFSCFHHAIKVRLSLDTPGVHFYWRHALSFAYQDGKEKRPVLHRTRQFPGGVHRKGPRTISFTYRNAWDCGVGDDVRRCARSAYGLYLVDAHGHVRRIDPIIQNGGSKY